jgi:hypothetical protein
MKPVLPVSRCSIEVLQVKEVSIIARRTNWSAIFPRSNRVPDGFSHRNYPERGSMGYQHANYEALRGDVQSTIIVWHEFSV